MRTTIHKKLSQGRVTTGFFGSSDAYGLTGAFFLQGPCGEQLKIIASNGDEPVCEGWEHVSVSCRKRCPNWEEMCFVKNLFWEDDECVVQFHPPKSDYVNLHPFCLHLWKHKTTETKLPPKLLIGF